MKKRLLESLKEQGFSKKILKAFSEVERENFIPERLRAHAYDNAPLPIGKGQTISQPYTIAFMLSLLDLEKSQKVLEAGSGSGYVLALISKIVGSKGKIFGLELVSELATRSKESLKQYKNVSVYNRNASSGLPNKAPFDRILVSASADSIPQKLVEQLKIRGILVVPVKNSIVYLKKSAKKNKIKEFPGFAFVPFIE